MVAVQLRPKPLHAETLKQFVQRRGRAVREVCCQSDWWSSDGFAGLLLGTRTCIVIAISGRGLHSWLITEASIMFPGGVLSTMGAQQRVLIVDFHVDVGTTVLLMREIA